MYVNFQQRIIIEKLLKSSKTNSKIREMLVHVLSRVIIIRDECWVYKYDIEQKRISLVRSTLEKSRVKTTRAGKPNVKVMVILFFDCRGISQFHAGKLFSAGANVEASGAHSLGLAILGFGI